MHAVILVGHGSLRNASGTAMIRLAARAQAAGVAPLVKAGFLNYSRPTFHETLIRVVAHGADEVTVVPYFLIPGKFVRVDLPRLVQAGQALVPDVYLRLAEPFGDHAALEDVLRRRAAECAVAAGLAELAPYALLLIAHGSPDEAANEPLRTLAARLEASRRYEQVALSFMALNQPSIPDAIGALVANGTQAIIAVPFFLQFGGHAAQDVPAIVAASANRFRRHAIHLAAYLGYDPVLVDVIRDRVAQAAEQ